VDILVLDLNLPGMGGLELLAKLRREKPALQVIILTGFGAMEAAQQAIRLDAVDFLTKPCGMGDLERALSRAFARIRPPNVKPRLAGLTASAPEDAGDAEDDEPFEDRLPACPALPEGEGPGPDAPLAEVERFHILRALQACEGNRRAAAKQLDISLRTLYYRLRQYGM
jgi:DNA-binding NtrC family response regulator